MPIILDVDHNRREVHSVALGPVSYADVENHLLTERHFGGLAYKELIDARGAGIVFTPAQARKIVELLRSLGRSSGLGPTAVLVDNDLAFGAMLIVEALTEDVAEVKPFRDETEARKWLLRP